MGPRKLLLVTLFGGALSGAVTAVVLSQLLAPTPSERGSVAVHAAQNERAAPANPKTERLGTAVRGMDNKLDNVEQRLAELEQRAADKPVEPAAEDLPPEQLDPEETSTAVFQRALTQHRAEPRDEEWAKPIETALHRDFTRLGKRLSADVEAVNCRNTTCTATLKWTHRKDATANWEQALTHPVSVGCERSLIVPPVQEGETGVSVDVLFECESWRADGSQMLSEEQLAGLQLPEPKPVY